MSQAVILAGGLGLRLRPLTESIPKAMVEIDGRPFLEWLILGLKSNGFHDFILLTGYLTELVENAFGDGSKYGISVRYSRETSPLGTCGAIVNALPLLENEFLLTYGDAYLPENGLGLLVELKKVHALGIMAIYHDIDRATNVTPNVKFDATSGEIIEYNKEGGIGFEFIEAGMMAFRKSIFDGVSLPLPQASLESSIFPNLIMKRLLIGRITTRRFYDIGTPLGLSELASTSLLRNIPL